METATKVSTMYDVGRIGNMPISVDENVLFFVSVFLVFALFVVFSGRR